jgi:YVTN family beta-propeller protein
MRFSGNKILTVALGYVMATMLILNGCTKEEEHHHHDLQTIITDNDTIVTIDSTVSSGHLLYVADEKSGTISIIKPSKGKRIISLPITPPSAGNNMLMPHNVQVAPDGKSVWVTAVPMKPGDMEQLVVINPNTNSIIKRINVGKNLHLAHIVFDDLSKNVFVTATDAGLIIQFDAINFTEIKRFGLPAGSKPHGMRYLDGKLYIANMGAKSMSVADVANGSITEVPLGGTAMQTAVTRNGKYAFITLYDTREVIRYELANGQITRISLPASSQGPVQIYATPDSRQLFVCDQGVLDGRPASNEVYIIDIENASVDATIKAGRAAHGVVISNDGKTAYVTNSGDYSVSVIDIAGKKVKNTITAGTSPSGISYWYGEGGMP